MSTQPASGKISLAEFNVAPSEVAVQSVLHWCAAPGWASKVVESRPYCSIHALAEHTRKLWADATHNDLLAAFAAHPTIGDVKLLRSKYAQQANTEQGQVLQASERTIQALAEQNIAYRKRHGFTFIVFATGKSAEQMLDLLNARIDNPTELEHNNAATEQLKIMQLRLEQSIHAEQENPSPS